MIRDRSRWIWSWASIALALVLLVPAARAGTTGKISGRVLDGKKQPVSAANVIVIGAPLGALTDDDGRYMILNVPAGTYSVKVSMLGYRAVTTTGVTVSADNTTRLDLELVETPVAMQEVVVNARRPVVEINRTSTLASVSRKEIGKLPVQELQDVVNLQAGVVDGHFRGGRKGEVQFQVDGVSVNNAYDNTAGLRLDRSLLEEVQVISGTFDAEYGQAMSGVVNAVLRRGGDKYEWDGEVLLGGYAYRGGGVRLQEFWSSPTDLTNFQITLSGPTQLPKTTFLLSGGYKSFNESTYGRRFYTPAAAPGDATREADIKAFVPDGDQKRVMLGTREEWSAIGKLTNRSIPNVELSYQVLLNAYDAQRADWTFAINPDGRTDQRTVSLVHGLDYTHTLSKTLFYNLGLRQNYWDYRDWKYENPFDSRYDFYGPAEAPTYPGFNGLTVQGVSFARFKQNTNAFVAKGSITNQISPDLQLKLGGEFTAPRIRFGEPGRVTYGTVSGGRQGVIRDRLGRLPESMPVFASAYAQNMVEWEDLTLRGGLRYEFFDARSSLPSDLSNPSNVIAGAPQSVPRATTNKHSLAPRIGVSYPISKTAALFFAYGHFYQLPSLGIIFTRANYDTLLRNLQAANPNYDVLGNPDIRPEKTVQYQFGYKQAITPDFGLEMNAFYKDIRDLLGVEFISTYNAAEYARWTNVDFGSVVGFTLTGNHRAIGPFTVTADYTWQIARGNTSDPRETATRAEAGEDPRPQQVALNWDQRHTFNMQVAYSQPDLFTGALVLRAASGQPYTPILDEGFGNSIEINSGRKPSAVALDLRLEKDVFWRGQTFSSFLRVFNAFDAKYFNGSVFESSGSPFYSRFPTRDEGALQNPTRLYAPRRIELGFTFHRGS